MVKNKIILGLFVTVGASSLTACGGSDAKKLLEEGQVVAKVNDTEITIHELNAELEGVQVPAGEQGKRVQQAALDRIITRKIIAQLAREKGLEDDPKFILQKYRAEETLLTKMYEQKIASRALKPSQGTVQAYVNSHPYMFTDRRILNVAQILFSMPSNNAVIAGLAPLKTFDEITSYLGNQGVEFKTNETKIDLLRINPELAKKIMDLPSEEVFVLPQNGMITVNRITGSVSEPLDRETSEKIAGALVAQQNAGELVKKELEPVIKAEKAKVEYQAGFKPEDVPASKAN